MDPKIIKRKTGCKSVGQSDTKKSCLARAGKPGGLAYVEQIPRRSVERKKSTGYHGCNLSRGWPPKGIQERKGNKLKSVGVLG